ncbi:MAG: hypothetical protein JWN56_2056 [Sphingobacteriales bacterium]|nr:hypothetical protein [Sphingobacteriales bacterium]
MILVTGATGFVGSELVRQLLAMGKSVRALKREKSTIPDILKSQANLIWITGDVLDYFSLEEAFTGIQYVYHCAAFISFNASDKKEMMRVNAEGTAHIVDLCLSHQVKKLVYVSSVAAVGDAKGHNEITEKNHWEFNGTQSAYSISKYASEMEVFRGIAEGLKAVIVNPSVIIGKNAGKSGSGALFTLVKKGLTYYPTGTIGLIDVEDVARTMITLMDEEITNQRYIINAENWSYHDFFTEIAHQLKLNPPSKPLKKWMAQLAVLGSSISGSITGKPSQLTAETARSAFKEQLFSNTKIKNAIGIEFKLIQQTIAEICAELAH